MHAVQVRRNEKQSSERSQRSSNIRCVMIQLAVVLLYFVCSPVFVRCARLLSSLFRSIRSDKGEVIQRSVEENTSLRTILNRYDEWHNTNRHKNTTERHSLNIFILCLWVCVSVLGSKGSADTARDVRGFATKFYTEEGNWDLVGNNIPVFFIQGRYRHTHSNQSHRHLNSESLPDPFLFSFFCRCSQVP